MRKILLILILLIPIVTHAKNFHPEVNSTLERDLIWISSSSKPGSNVYLLEFRVWFKHPASKVFDTLTDTMSFTTKMTSYKDARTLTKKLYKKILDANPNKPEQIVKLIGDNKISSHHNRQRDSHWNDYTYLHFNFPWPLTDRWAVQKIDIDETNAHKKEYKYKYETKLSNFKTLTGEWELVPIPDHPDWIEFRGTYESNPSVPVPKFITKKAMKVSFKKEMETNRQILKILSEK